jgi:hypothetical protein
VKKLSLLFACSVSVFSEARETTVSKVDCSLKTWGYPKMSTYEDVKIVLHRTPRAEIIQMLWQQLAEKNEASFVIPLLHYLSATETQAARRKYFENISVKLFPKSSLQSLVFEWPKAIAIEKASFKLSALCDAYSSLR